MSTRFSQLFKKYRLKSEFSTLSELGMALAEKGFIYEDSIFSHWQKGSRVPNNRELLKSLIKIFIEREAIQSIDEANDVLSSVNQGYLTMEECEKLQTTYPSFQKATNLRIQAAKSVIEDIPNLLNLIGMSSSQFGNSEFRIFKGKKQVNQIYDEALAAKELRTYADLFEVFEYFPENCDRFYFAMKTNPNLKMREIIDSSVLLQKRNFDKRTLDYFSNNAIFDYAKRLLPKHMKLARVDTLIFDGKVGIVNLREDLQGVILENASHFENTKNLFDLTWQGLSSEM